MEEDKRSLCDDTARPSPGETKDRQMSVWITSNKIKVSSGYIPSHALRSLPCDRCKVSGKASSPESQTWCFPFQIPVAYVVLKSSSSCLRLLPCLLHSFPSIVCFNRQFQLKMWPIPVALLLVIVCRMFLSSLTLCNISPYFTRSV